jgi:hypothetical protein
VPTHVSPKAGKASGIEWRIAVCDVVFPREGFSTNVGCPREGFPTNENAIGAAALGAWTAVAQIVVEQTVDGGRSSTSPPLQWPELHHVWLTGGDAQGMQRARRGCAGC